MGPPEVEPHHHRTGHRWLDFVLAGSAMLISVVSLVVAIRHGDTMERLVEANTWPNISYGTSNEDDSGKPVTRVCYCSVFDDCWLRDSRERGPKRVDACPVPPVPYQP